MKNWPDGIAPATIFDWIVDMSPAEHETKTQVIDYRREEKKRLAGVAPNPFEDAAERKRKTGIPYLPPVTQARLKEEDRKKYRAKKLKARIARDKRIEAFDQKQKDYLRNLAVEAELARHQKRMDEEDRILKDFINEAGSAGIGHGEEQALTMDMILDAEHARTKPTEDSDIAGLLLDPTIMFEQYRGDFGGLHTHCSLHFEEDPYTVTPRKNRF